MRARELVLTEFLLPGRGAAFSGRLRRRRGSSPGVLQAPRTLGSHPRASRGASSRPPLAPPQDPRLGLFGRGRGGQRARLQGHGPRLRRGSGSRGPPGSGRVFFADFARIVASTSQLSGLRAPYRAVGGGRGPDSGRIDIRAKYPKNSQTLPGGGYSDPAPPLTPLLSPMEPQTRAFPRVGPSCR